MNAKQLAEQTSNAYSADRYGSQWVNCAELLLELNFSVAEVEQVLRSKHMRWAADGAKEHTVKGFFIGFAAYLARRLESVHKDAAQGAAEAESGAD